MSNRRNGSSRLLLGSTALAVPGAVFQAMNNVAAGAVRASLMATPSVTAYQAMWAALFVAFSATLSVAVLLQRSYRNTDKAFSWRLPPRRVLLWHEIRLVVGFAATLLIFSASQQANFSHEPPVALVTVLASTGAIYLAMNDLRRYHRFDGFALVAAQLFATSLGFGGILIATWQSLAGTQGFSWPIAAAAVAGFLLGCLQLVQKKLSRGFNEPAVKVVGLFAAQATLVSFAGLVVTTLQSGVLPALSFGVVLAAGALAFCYAASQLLLQLANGFGNPALVGVLIYLSIPSGFALDFFREGRIPSRDELIGSACIAVAACLAKALEGALSARRPAA